MKIIIPERRKKRIKFQTDHDRQRFLSFRLNTDGQIYIFYFRSGASGETRKNHYLKDVANHDINDAFAVLWTVERIYRREAGVIPAEAEFDSVGLRMGIWY